MKTKEQSEVQQAAVEFIQQYSSETPLGVQLEDSILIQKLKLLNINSFILPLHFNSATIAERTIQTPYDYYGLRMSLYYMPKGTIMGLHNHPKMMVLSYIIQGLIKATFYTPQENSKKYIKEEEFLPTGSLTYIDGLRTQDRNLHQLRAEQSTLFLDIIFPDYDDEQRDCLCYKEVKQLQENIYELRQVPCSLVMLPL